jgi:four helix bundle protein
MTQKEMKQRTGEFAKRIIKLCRALPDNREGRLIGDQLFRAGTSVASNSRAACRARSTAEFIAKLGIVEEEGDESLYWLELLRELQIVKLELLTDLIQEGNEILSIAVSSLKTAKRKNKSEKIRKNPKSEIRKNPKSQIHQGNIFEFNGFKPVIHESAFIHPNATVTGNVVIGRDVYVGPGAAIRGDWGEIIISDGCNVQENCTIHMFPGVTVVLEESAHIGHGAIIHGGRIGRNSLVGMNAVVMDNVIVGEECIIGALCFVPEGMEIPRRKIVVGNPAKIVKGVSGEMIAWKSEGTRLYQSLPKQLYETLRPCEPLREVPDERPKQEMVYHTWRKTKGG